MSKPHNLDIQSYTFYELLDNYQKNNKKYLNVLKMVKIYSSQVQLVLAKHFLLEHCMNGAMKIINLYKCVH